MSGNDVFGETPYVHKNRLGQAFDVSNIIFFTLLRDQANKSFTYGHDLQNMREPGSRDWIVATGMPRMTPQDALDGKEASVKQTMSS